MDTSLRALPEPLLFVLFMRKYHSSYAPLFFGSSHSSCSISFPFIPNRQKQFLHKFRQLVDTSTKSKYWHFAVNRWLGVRLEWLGGLTILFTSFFCVYFTAPTSIVSDSNATAERETERSYWMFFQISSTLAVVSLSYVMKINVNLNWLVRQNAELEISMNAVSR